MNIISYESAYGIPFGASLSDVKRVFGEPTSTASYPKRESRVIWYPGVGFNLINDQMVECTSKLDGEILLNEAPLNKETVISVIARMDPDYLEYVGTMISYKLGVSLDLEHLVLTAFVRGRMDIFKAIANKAL